MKGKRVAALVLTGALAIGTYNCYSLVQTSKISSGIKPGVVYAESTPTIEVKNHDERAKKALAKYFGVKPEYDSLKQKMMTESAEEAIESYDRTIEFFNDKTEDMSADELAWLESMKKDRARIKSGTISVSWHSEDYSDTEHHYVIFNDMTNEVEAVMSTPSIDLSQVDSNEFTTFEEALAAAESFIILNKLDDIEKPTLIGQSQYKNHSSGNYNETDSIMLFFEDEENSNRKANVIVDRILGQVTYFSHGQASTKAYTKNGIYK